MRQHAGMTTAPAIERRRRRAKAARSLARRHDGVAHRRDLRRLGVTRHDVRVEVLAGRWATAGRHTVVIGAGTMTARARLWQAVWETGSGAVLDGAAALVASGLTGHDLTTIDVALPVNNRHHAVDGVRRHRRRALGEVISVGLPRVRPEAALVRAAQWAASDRLAALLVCQTVQQGIVPADRVLTAWRAARKRHCGEFLDAVIRDVCDGAHSLGELDVAALCREYAVPEPTRQVVRTGTHGRVYLDAAWEGLGLVLEVDGAQHFAGLAPIEDALRQNEVVLSGDRVLRLPVLGLRLQRDEFMAQVVRAVTMCTEANAARGAGPA